MVVPSVIGMRDDDSEHTVISRRLRLFPRAPSLALPLPPATAAAAAAAVGRGFSRWGYFRLGLCSGGGEWEWEMEREMEREMEWEISDGWVLDGLDGPPNLASHGRHRGLTRFF